jgi:hypothetical protein
LSCAKSQLAPFNRSKGVVSLLDMLRTHVYDFASAGASISEIQCSIAKACGASTNPMAYGIASERSASSEIMQEFIQLLNELLIHCTNEGLIHTLDLVKEMQLVFAHVINTKSSYSYSAVLALVSSLDMSYRGELKREVYLHLLGRRLDLYSEPEGEEFGGNIFGKAVRLSFPSMSYEIREAGNSFAMERWTACVFHAMRILELALHILARELKITFPNDLELENWKNVIDKIESTIKDMEQLPKSKDKSDKLKFFFGAAMQFRWFKDAWRNHVAHVRESYDEGRALSIINHVGEFVEQLANGGLRDDLTPVTALSP